MSLFGGSSAPATQTSTTSTEPSKLAAPFVEQVFGEAQNLFGQGPLSFFPGQTVAGPTQTELAGRQGLVNLATAPGPEQQTVTQAFQQFLGRAPGAEGIQFWVEQLKQGSPPEEVINAIRNSPEAQDFQRTGQAVQLPQNLKAPLSLPEFLGQGAQTISGLLQQQDVTKDPIVQNLANAATEPLFQQFTERVLPQVGSAAVAAGAFGGSRQQILEQDLTRDLFRTAGDVRAGVFGNAQARQLEQQKAALALFPQFANLQTLPSQILGQVGAAERGDAQQQINAERERFEFGQLSPLTNLQNFSNFVNQFGGGITTASGPSGISGASPISSALGGGLLGGQAASFLPAALGVTGPVGFGIGAGLGLLGFL